VKYRILKLNEHFIYLTTIINLILVVIYFPIVPCLGWLNYGHGGTSGWIPEALLINFIPLCYIIYSKYGLLIALIAIIPAIVYYRETKQQIFGIFALLNALTIIVFCFITIGYKYLQIISD
jgi:hypothetical protein